MLWPPLAIEMSITHNESTRQEQPHAPALIDSLLLFGPWPLPLYFKKGAILKKWSILLSNIPIKKRLDVTLCQYAKITAQNELWNSLVPV
jgi:hypothetical protein